MNIVELNNENAVEVAKLMHEMKPEWWSTYEEAYGQLTDINESIGTIGWFLADENHNIVYTFYNEKQNKDVYMVALREKGKLIGYYEKHEYRNKETMKMYDLW